jgi:hypothetical protein
LSPFVGVLIVAAGLLLLIILPNFQTRAAAFQEET